MNLLESIRASALLRDERHLRRTRRVHDAREGVWSQVSGQRLLNFSSNDYLGFAQHPEVTAAFIRGARQCGTGSAGSALVTGYFSAHQALERQAAELFGYEACLYVGSGYLANIGVLQTLLDENAVCVQDRLNHACLLDGARFSGCRLKRFPHQDMDSAEKLCAETGNLAFLVSDGVFSMDGDAANLPELARITGKTNATLMIDDAHGVGVLGDTGLGSLQAAQLGAADVPLLIIPAGKALGGQGALILSNADIINHLVETARSYLFSTAPAPAMACALSQALQCLQREPEHHARLQHNIRHFSALAAQAKLPVLPSQSAIHALMAGSNENALQVAEQLRERGFWLSAIRPPTVPKGKARLRITLTALHQPEHIERLVEALHAIGRQP
ncbi:MAG: 8-amino-7-oxononanoate synthase [Arenimonas sp.]|nr:8-amino-7-oxononanoate synthase [Arenimonas sp.]